MPGLGTLTLPGLPRPETAFVPLVRRVGGDILRKVHPFQSRKLPGHLDRLLRVHVGAGEDATALGALIANDSSELTRVDVRYRDRFAAAKVVRQAALGAPVADGHGQIAHDQAGGVNGR